MPFLPLLFSRRCYFHAYISVTKLQLLINFHHCDADFMLLCTISSSFTDLFFADFIISFDQFTLLFSENRAIKSFACVTFLYSFFPVSIAHFALFGTAVMWLYHFMIWPSHNRMMHSIDVLI